MTDEYDVVIVGAGHNGLEPAIIWRERDGGYWLWSAAPNWAA